MKKPLSARSIKNLSECHPDLIALFTEVHKYYPCEIIEGHRGQEEQDRAFAEKRSKVQWPNGEHNKIPSHAVDALPLPIDWNNRDAFFFFAGYVLATAEQLGIRIRWGGDWDSDKDLKDESFRDLVHFELT